MELTVSVDLSAFLNVCSSTYLKGGFFKTLLHLLVDVITCKSIILQLSRMSCTVQCTGFSCSIYIYPLLTLYFLTSRSYGSLFSTWIFPTIRRRTHHKSDLFPVQTADLVSDQPTDPRYRICHRNCPHRRIYKAYSRNVYLFTFFGVAVGSLIFLGISIVAGSW